MPGLQKHTGRKLPVKFIIKLGVTAGLFFLISRSVNLQAALASLARLSPAVLAVAIALQLTSTCVSSFRWFLIMRRIGSPQPFFFFLKSYFKGAFFNQGLPTSIGGDAVRILDCARVQESAINGFYGVFIDRIVGLAGLLILNIGALLIDRTLLPSRVYYALLVILVLLLSGLVLLFYLRRFSLFSRGKWLGYLGQLSERYFQVYSTPSSMGTQLGLSVLTHLLAMAAFYVLGVSVGLNYPLTVYLVLVPPVILLTILPISMAGWGVREGAMIGFFLLIGADRSKVLSLSILYGLLALVASLPGLLVYVSQKNRL
ncbi:hypothetical protein BMS3Bbin14_02065 [bacterium BMS3Bbin14]|nr:hypothetical protein BMS3Abin13_00529 [bacterium BMS3Abin13]GBE53567.1 hypothetical protein BMS3Bbin14_02065 [bacterium BMS3Bbin14]HDK44009.1 flippase-like domain-containing protein [Desulfobacteraceae bacterium]HDL98787.1 flippase-like domain-containing protein [Desulfobacteraceae bacterium]HDO29840.1 flippase-like domain-containing protein [Desulfobacteraceae bacterium]